MACKGRSRIEAFRLVIVMVCLGAAACGEITAFCMSAGAPSGVALQVTTTPTGRVECGMVRADSTQGAAVDLTTP